MAEAPTRAIRVSAELRCGFSATRTALAAREDDEHRELFVSTEAVIHACRDERGLTDFELKRLSADVQLPASFEHDVHLVVRVRLLAVGLRRDQNVDADLEPRALVDDLIAAARLLEPSLRLVDAERVP
jgi:hypothetical protein